MLSSKDTIAQDYPRHRWLRIKEGFAPGFANDLILEIFPNRGIVLDPFGGSFTTALSAAALGHRTVSMDVNPYFCLAGKVKTRNYRRTTLLNDVADVYQGLRQGKPSSLVGYSTFSERGDGQPGLFSPAVLNAVAGGLDASNRLTAAAKDLITIALVQAAMQHSNAKKDGKALRYLPSQPLMSDNELLESYCETVTELIAQMRVDICRQPELPGEAQIWKGDIRNIGHKLPDDSIGCVLTSPPYLNSLDYSDVYRPELFLSGLIRDTTELRRIRLKSLRSHIQVKWPMPKQVSLGETYDSIASVLKQRTSKIWDRRIVDMVRAYFTDLKSVLRLLHRKTVKKGSACFVVATSAYGGVEIPVDSILVEIAKMVGWKETSIISTRKIRSSGQHMKVLKSVSEGSWGVGKALRESVLLFSK